MKYKFLQHTADMKFQAFGKTLAECFENSAYALLEIITKDKIKKKIKKDIFIKGKDKENLLYNFLEEFLFLLDSKNFILSEIKEIYIKENKEFELSAVAWFDEINKYKTIGDVKAITYNDMFVRQEGKQFVSQVVVDV